MLQILNKKLTKKGFTLAELLVVVAILAILVAVSIPIFSGKLDEARTSTDLANERAAKAAAVVEYLSSQITTDTSYVYDAKNGTVNTTNNMTNGYNQTTGTTSVSKMSDKDSGIVKIDITDKGKKVTATWVAKGASN